MALPLLRHYAATVGTSAASVLTVPASRALVLSKLIVAANGSSTLTIQAGSTYVTWGLPLTAGQVYTETGIVLTAGEQLFVQGSVANVLALSVFGEEVDN